MTTEEIVLELKRLRSLALALSQEIERVQRKVEAPSVAMPTPSSAPKKIPSLQMPAVARPAPKK